MDSRKSDFFKKPLSIITVTHERADVLAKRVLPSLLNQSCKNFQWVIINDGKDEATRDLIAGLEHDLHIDYHEIEHPSEGFGLCHGRNLGLEMAEGELVSYLDDDNTAAPKFVQEVLDFFASDSEVKCAMVQQSRRREGTLGDQQVRHRTFISPSINVSASALLRQEELFDSNGFVHRRMGAPVWNPEYRIYADYEYFLSCLGIWSEAAFTVLPKVLTEYVQSREGVIGRSHYGQWAEELQNLLAHCSNYPVLSDADCCRLVQLAKKYAERHCQGTTIPAFV
jgi:glycosyltransferase involved in cell wall biosynthesis